MITSFEQNHPHLSSSGYIILASFLYPIMGVLVRSLTKLTVFQVMTYRQAFICGINSLQLTEKDDVYAQEIRGALLRRSIFYVISTYTFYSACKLGPIWKAALFEQSTPLWVMLISVFVLKTQPFSKKLLITILISFVGILMIIRPPFIIQMENMFLNKDEKIETSSHEEDSFKSTVFGIGSAISYTLTTLAIAPLKGKTTNRVMVQCPAILGICLFSIAQITQGQKVEAMSIIQIFMMLLIGVVGFTCQTLMNKAFLIGQITYISILGQSEIVFAFFYDLILFNEEIQIVNLIGVLLVLITLGEIVWIKNSS